MFNEYIGGFSFWREVKIRYEWIREELYITVRWRWHVKCPWDD